MGTGGLAIETSWLPGLSEVASVLEPLGFSRLETGCYRVVLSVGETRDHLRIVRLATRALGVLLEEGYV
jgi:hypothetical protein